MIIKVYTMKCTLEDYMKITTKELRIQPGKIIEQVVHGQEITVTFRGKALARIVPIGDQAKDHQNDDTGIFGLWKNHNEKKNVEKYVRGLRKGRQF